MAIKKLSRLETNKDVRRILVRNGVDTTKVQFSCHGKSVSITGGLYKDGGQEFEIILIENIMQSLLSLGYQIQFDERKAIIFFVSARSDLSSEDCIKLGAHQYFSKPLNVKKLVYEVEKVLSKSIKDGAT